jgi:gliding motility-associated-like protein
VKKVFTLIVLIILAGIGYSLAISGPLGTEYFIDSNNKSNREEQQQVTEFVAYTSITSILADTIVPAQGCQYNSIQFNGPEAESWAWNFGDMQSESDTSSLRNPQYTYNEPGTYTVNLTYVVNGDTNTLTPSTITILASPEVDLGPNDTVKCADAPLFLDAGNAGAGFTYLWSTGDTTQTIQVDSADCYSVTVTDPVTGCSNSDRIFVSVCGEERKEAATWYFGNGAGLDFKEGEPTPLTDGAVNAAEGVSVISDFIGNLLFYTDGRTVYNSDHGTMPNGTGLPGGAEKAQGALIVPQPADCRNCPSLYYIFTIGDDGNAYYAKVDMRLDGGNGDVIYKDSLLFTNATERITSIENPRDSTFWVVGQDAGGTLKVYHITKHGMRVDSVQNSVTAGVGEGYMKASADGNYLAITVSTPDFNGVEIYTFDDSLGTITGPPILLDVGRPAPPAAYGVEFAADNSTIYVSLSGDSSFIYQFNISDQDSAAIADSRVLIDSTDQTIGALQRGPNGKIYVAIDGSSSLGVINNPSGVGDEVDYQAATVDLSGKTSRLGLPNFTNTFIQPPGGPGFSYADTCANSPTQFMAGAICSPRRDTLTWTFGDGTTLANTQEQLVEHSYASPGTYTVSLRLWNGCKDTTITQQITILEPPKPVSITTNGNSCEGSLELDAGANVAGSTYLWSTGQTGQKITVTEPGTYSVLVDNAGCQETASISVTFESTPVNLGGDTTICAGQTITLDAGNPGSTYRWSNAANTRTISVSPTQTTQYWVEVTDRFTSCPGRDTIVVSVVALPDTAGFVVTNSTGCTQSDGSITRANNPADVTYAWTGPGITDPSQPNQTALAPGNYTLTMTREGGCSVQKTFAVNADQSTLNFTSNAPQLATCANNMGTITLKNNSGATGTLTYRWTRRDDGTEAGTDSSLTAPPGFYNVEIVEVGTGCKFFLSNLEIQPSPNKPQVTADYFQSGCNEYTLQGYSNPANVTYVWKDPAGQPIQPIAEGRAKTTQSGIHSLEVTSIDDPNCVSIIEVDLPALPEALTVVASEPAAGCEGDIITITSTVTGGSGRYIYAWREINNVTISGATNQPSLQVSRNGTYELKITDRASGCEKTSNRVKVTINTIPVADIIQSDITICAGPTVRLEAANVTNATYKWSNGETGREINVTPTATTTYSVTVSRNGCSTTDAVTITINPVPVADLGPDQEVCPNVPTTISAYNSANQNNLTYSWTLNDIPLTVTTAEIQAENEGLYSVTISNGNCSSSDDVFIQYLPMPDSVVEDTMFVCVGDEETITLDAGGSGYTYLWPHSNETTRQVTVNEPGIYRVQISNQHCTLEEEFTVLEGCEPRIFVPEAFSPNGDMNNDLLQIFGAYIGSFEFIIYNRWGEIIFATSNLDTSWDGTYKGKPVPVGSYAWTLNYTSEYFPERSVVRSKGALMLIR